MKKLLSAIAVSMGALMATSAMAAPYNHHDNRYQEQRHQDHRYQQPKHWDNGRNDNRYDRGYNRYKAVNPSRDWHRGQVLPREYSSSRYIVNYQNHRHLSKPNRNQNWYKINGDYVLVNLKNGKIMRIIG